MNILIADDHAVFRHGLKDILSKRFPGCSFGEAETSQAVLDLVWKQPWDVVILDITMPGRSGLEILKEIHQARPKLPVLVLSMHAEDQYGFRVLQAGAQGYISKIKAPSELVGALEKVLGGGKYISHEIVEKLVNHLQPGAEKPSHQLLSNREYQVLSLITSGESMKDIATQLSVSIQTVSTHRARILKKLGLRTTASLIRYALENRLVD